MTKRTQTLVDNYFARKLTAKELMVLRDIADDEGDSQELSDVANAIAEIVRLQKQGH